MRIWEFLSLLFGTLLLYSSMTCRNYVHTPSGAASVRSEAKVLGSNDMKKNEDFRAEDKSEKLKITKDLEGQKTFIKNNEALRGTSLAPAYMKGIYITNSVVRNAKRLESFIKQAKNYGINTFVIDIQPKMPAKKNITLVTDAGLYVVARLVVFPDGMKSKRPPKGHAKRMGEKIQDAAYQGFQEVQLDYIRYADTVAVSRLSLSYKYNVIDRLLKELRETSTKAGVKLSADVFGRITINHDDHIGQKLENFATYTDALYPMLYPSHYLRDKKRMSNPYFTVKEGVKAAKERLSDTKVIAYIQGFSYNVSYSGLSLSEYVKKQMNAVKDAKGDGWVIWNPRNVYKASYAAMAQLEKEISEPSVQ